MATSGTYAFDLDLGDAIEESFELAGLELRSGYDYRTARRSINLIMLEWQNRGLNLWTVEFASEQLTSGDETYPLSADKLDIVEAFIRTNSGNTSSQFDQTLTRISGSQYAHLSNKLTSGKPLQFWLDKKPSGITFNLWPVPDSQQTYHLSYYYLRRVEDAGKPASLNMSIPVRYLPCLVAGLAYQLCLKYVEANAKAPIMKAEYESQWTLAADADREKASIYVSPGGYKF